MYVCVCVHVRECVCRAKNCRVRIKCPTPFLRSTCLYNVCVHVGICVCICVHACVCVYVRTRVCLCVYVSTHACVCICCTNECCG
jgi:hypothetical protein